MKPSHPGGIHIVACADRDGVAQVVGGELHRKFKDARLVALMYRMASECSVIVGPNAGQSFAYRALGKRLIVLTRDGRLPRHMTPGTTIVASSIEHALSLCPKNEKVMIISGINTFATFIPLANRITILMLKTMSIIDEGQKPIKLPEWDSLYTPGVTDRWRRRDDGSIVHIEIANRIQRSEICPLMLAPLKQPYIDTDQQIPKFIHSAYDPKIAPAANNKIVGKSDLEFALMQ
jgi:dihydrofolate reductase